MPQLHAIPHGEPAREGLTQEWQRDHEGLSEHEALGLYIVTQVPREPMHSPALQTIAPPPSEPRVLWQKVALSIEGRIAQLPGGGGGGSRFEAAHTRVGCLIRPIYESSLNRAPCELRMPELLCRGLLSRTLDPLLLKDAQATFIFPAEV